MDISDVTIEFFSDSEEHLQILESQLKHIRDVDVYLIEILLFTIEGGRIDLEPLTAEEIEGIIVTAKKEE